MNRKFWRGLVIGLVAVNLCFIAYTLLADKSPQSEGRQNPGPKNMIINKLGFDDQQVLAYEKEIKKHREAVRGIEPKLHQAKSNYFTSNDSASSAFYLNEIAALHQQMDQVHKNHFLAIKDICKEEQLGRYNDLMKEIGNIFMPGPKRPRKGK